MKTTMNIIIKILIHWAITSYKVYMIGFYPNYVYKAQRGWLFNYYIHFFTLNAIWENITCDLPALTQSLGISGLILRTALITQTYATRKKDTMNQIHTELCETPICFMLSNRSKESVSFHSLMNTTIKTKIYTMVDNIVVTSNKLYRVV